MAILISGKIEIKTILVFNTVNVGHFIKLKGWIQDTTVLPVYELKNIFNIYEAKLERFKRRDKSKITVR